MKSLHPNHMDPQLTFQQVQESLPAYVLGALEPEEMLAIDDYLSSTSDPKLLDELQRLEETVVQLDSLSSSFVTPPVVKTQLFERVNADVAQKMAPALNPSSTEKQASSLFHGWRNRLSELLMSQPSLAWGTVGLLLVLLLLTGGYSSQLQEQLNESYFIINTLEQQLDAQEQRLASTQEKIEVFVQAEHHVRLASLTNTKATGTLSIGVEQKGVLTLQGLPILDEEQNTYQLWLIPAEGEPRDAGLVALSDEALNTLTIDLPENALEFVAVGLSREPVGGSEQPTDVIMLGHFQEE